jgi:endoglucanase
VPLALGETLGSMTDRVRRIVLLSLALVVALVAIFVSTAPTPRTSASTIDEGFFSASGVPTGNGDVVKAAPLKPIGSKSVDETVPASPSRAADLPGWLHTDGGSIKTATNDTYIIKAAAWFGMETTNCAPHGLWSISLEAGLAQIKSMGFNTIRLPYSNECLAAASTNSINFALNPTLEGLTPQQVMDAVITRAKDAGLNVLLDRHRPGSAAQSDLWYTPEYSEERWIADWEQLAERYKNEPAVIGFDLHNEPHGAACWGCGDTATDWQAAATRAGNAVQQINPQLLIVIEGVEKQSSSSSTWWGGGLAAVASAPVSLSVANQVVYSPHDYPASIYPQKWFSASTYPGNLPAVWDANWGYLAKSGTAPILLGEFGTRLETTSDQQWLDTLVSYLGNSGMSFAYWSFNPNSGDTGGLVMDDWTTPQAAKLAALAPLLDVNAPVPPVSAEPATPAPSSAPVVPAPNPPAAAPPAVSPPAASPAAPLNPVVTAEWRPQTSWDAGYVVELDISSTTGASGWTVTWSDPAVTGISHSWGMTCTFEERTSVTCTGDDWGALLAAGQTQRVGVQVAASAMPDAPALSTTAN